MSKLLGIAHTKTAMNFQNQVMNDLQQKLTTT